MPNLYGGLEIVFVLQIPWYSGQMQQKNNSEIDNYEELCFSSKRNKTSGF